MRSRSFLGLGPNGFHRVAWHEWGDPAAERVVVCVHGLTRNGHDFDTLAEALAGDARIVCPDVVGRGDSDWLAVQEDYNYPQYVSDMVTLIAATGAREVDWVGTSMGGIIGMAIAAMPGAPIRRLVLNDIGPLVAKAGLDRIAGYVGLDPRFPDRETAVAMLVEGSSSFGPMTAGQRERFAEIGLMRHPDGSWGLNYDPRIAWSFRGLPQTDIDLWSYWEAIRCPVMVLRGALSDLLLPETVRQMAETGPRASVMEVPGVGHTPALMDDIQVEAIRAFLSGDGR